MRLGYQLGPRRPRPRPLPISERPVSTFWISDPFGFGPSKRSVTRNEKPRRHNIIRYCILEQVRRWLGQTNPSQESSRNSRQQKRHMSGGSSLTESEKAEIRLKAKDVLERYRPAKKKAIDCTPSWIRSDDAPHAVLPPCTLARLAFTTILPFTRLQSVTPGRSKWRTW